MYKTVRNLTIVSAFFVVSLVISNVIASKIIQIGWIEIPAAVIAYPITFLCTDIVSEIWGKKEAQFLVRLGFVVQVFSLVLIMLAVFLPPASYMQEFQGSFADVLGSNWRFVVASMAAYLAAQSFDVWIFHRVKARFQPKWMRNGTTVVSQLIDTAIFITVAFAGVVPNLLVLIFSQYLVKVLFAVVDTPFFYYFTRHGNSEPPADNYRSP
ncbi:MAG: queuosine precursor transporter [Methanocorpusculum sp.]|nr:queuosine precursor transporter [Methanocorpusculum sp.]